MILYRPYQDELHDAIVAAIRAGKRRILAQLPTGGGKTMVGTRFMRGAEAKGNPSVFLAPRRELIYQTVERLRMAGIEAGMIMAGEAMHSQRLCQVASFDTLHARVMRKKTLDLPRARVVVVDEAHLSLAETRQEIIRAFGDDVIIIAMTATPARADGKPLGALYDCLILGWDTGKMVAEGYLVDTRYYAPTTPDLKGVRSRAGDYVIEGLDAEMNRPILIGDVVDNWGKLAERQSTVVFGVTRAHGRNMTDAFRAAGVRAEFVDGETPEDDRRGIFARVGSGETTVLVNVFVASYGLDIPRLAVCQLARPTKSLVLYLQMAGRTLRPVYADWATPEMLLEGADIRLAAIADSAKPYSILIDHAGAIDRHGFLDAQFPWTLEGDESISDVMERQRKEREEPKEITCPKCKFVFRGTRYCPKCGHELVPPGEAMPTYKTDLVEKVRDGTEANRKTSWDDKIEFMAQAKGYANSKGYKDGFAANLYKDKFGVWPNDSRVRDAAVKPPGELIKGWIKHKAMKKRFSKVRT